MDIYGSQERSNFRNLNVNRFTLIFGIRITNLKSSSSIISQCEQNKLLPLSLATTKKRENPVNTAQKMASKSSTTRDEEATTEEVPGSICDSCDPCDICFHVQFNAEFPR